MKELFNAITLAVGHATLNPSNLGRFDWLMDEQSEVLRNSNLGRNARAMTTELFCQAFYIKLGAHFEALNAGTGHYVLVDAVSRLEIRSSFRVVKSIYKVRGAAERAAAKLNAAGAAVEVVTWAEHVASDRGVIRANLLSGRWYVEPMGLPSYLSPACEAYHSM